MLEFEYSRVKGTIAPWKRATTMTAAEQGQACDLLREAMLLVECEVPHELAHAIEQFLGTVGARSDSPRLN